MTRKSRRSNRRRRANNANNGRNVVSSTYQVPNNGSTKQFTKGAIPRGVVEKVCSQIDPFCGHANGAKLFDSNATKTIPWQIRSFQTITTDANGSAAVMLQPCLSSFYRTAQTITGSDVTAWNAYSTVEDYTNMLTYFQEYRIVNCGARVISQASATSSQGIIHMITLPEVSPDINWSSNHFPEIDRYTLAGADLHWISKPHAQNDVFQAIVTTGMPNNALCVAVSGAAAATSVAAIEIVMNVEFTPDTESSFSRVASNAAPCSVAIQQAASNAVHVIPSSHRMPESQFSNMLKREASRALHNSFGGLAQAGIGMVEGALEAGIGMFL